MAKELLGTKTALTITLTSLASGAGRQSTMVDNTTNLFFEAQLAATFKTAGSGTLATSPVVSLYAYGSLDGTTWADGLGASDAAWTPPAIINGVLLLQVPTPALGTAYPSIIRSVALAFGGTLPPYWLIAVVNNTAVALDGTAGGSISYVGVTTQ